MANFIYDSAVQMRDNKNENDKEQDPRREEECSAVQYSEYCTQTLKNQPRAGGKNWIYTRTYVIRMSPFEVRRKTGKETVKTVKIGAKIEWQIGKIKQLKV